MPRADPTRSDYCASRHLLRNLEDVAELRRNPLVRDYFPGAAIAPRRRDTAVNRIALGRIRDDVRAALARCSDYANDRGHVALGRMHAVLLRCEIDDQPLPVVAAEIGLSERQVRRERRAAHDAFVRAFRAAACDAARAAQATVSDVGTVRLAEAVELHELGQGALAQAAFASIAAGAPDAALRIEALCLAAEGELDALRHDAAGAHLAHARAVLLSRARELDDGAARGADEHIDFVAWSLNWQTGAGAGLALPPPLAVGAAGGGDRARDEPRRALFVRAAAAYATQRIEVGDGRRGCEAVRRALDVLPSLHAARTRERLAILTADAHAYSLHVTRGADRHRFRSVEKLAAAHGHVRAMLGARAQRISGAAAAGPAAVGRIAERIFRPFGAAERNGLARTLASAAQCVAQCEANPRDAVAGAQLVERLLPARNATALMARQARANLALAANRYDEARAVAQSVYDDAELAGNGRIRGIAARTLAAIALRCRRRAAARRFIRESLSLDERYGCPEALARTTALARRLDIA